MKKLKFWLMAMLAIVATASLSACSDDEKDEPDVIDSPIVGTWVYDSNSGNYSEEVTFSAKGRYVWVSHESYDEDYDFYEEGTYTVNGDNVTLKCTKIAELDGVNSDYVGETTTFKWSVTGNALTLQVGGGSPDSYTRKK